MPDVHNGQDPLQNLTRWHHSIPLTPISAQEFDQLTDAIESCTTREQLDRLTRAIWRGYTGDGRLEDLQAAIERRRAELDVGAESRDRGRTSEG